MTGAGLGPCGRPPAAAALGAALAFGAVASCARQGAPPGGPPDNLSPEVVATRPDTFAALEVLEGRIRIEFSERISEQPTRGTLNDAVLVSPRSDRVSVSYERDALEVELSEGFRPGVVYRVTVLPVVRDLFGNPMSAPFELVFSTGGEYHPNAVAGLVVDRITGQMVEDAQVAARPDWDDSLDLVYVSRTDTSGIYALRYLPPGRYRLQAFQDRDRDGEASSFEVQGERVLLLGAADTILGGADIVVLMPDTSPARLARATVQDSIRIGLTFDDHLDPLASLGEVGVALEPVPDTAEEGQVTVPPAPPPVERTLHEREYRAWQDSVAEVRALADSLAAEAAADSAAAAGDTTAVAAVDTAVARARAAAARRAEGAARIPRPGEVPRPPGQEVRAAGGEPGALPDGTPLPAQSLVVVLGGALPPGASYRIRVSGVVNVNGVGGGGGEAVVIRPEAPPDTAGAVVDTGAVAPPDTGRVRLPGRRWSPLRR